VWSWSPGNQDIVESMLRRKLHFKTFMKMQSDDFSLQWVITVVMSLNFSTAHFFAHYCANTLSICRNHFDVPKATLFGQIFNSDFSVFLVFFFSRLCLFPKVENSTVLNLHSFQSTLISIKGYHQRCENGYLPETIRVSLHCENGSCLESTLISVKGY